LHKHTTGLSSVHKPLPRHTEFSRESLLQSKCVIYLQLEKESGIGKWKRWHNRKFYSLLNRYIAKGQVNLWCMFQITSKT